MAQALRNLAMYDRVDVVREATGLVNNPSATINLERQRPTDKFQANMSVNVGSWHDLSATLDVRR